MNFESVRTEDYRAETGSIALKIDSQINISSVGRLLLQLASNLELADEVFIDLSGVTEIDFAGLQLFCSCHRSSLLATKRYRIIGQDHPAIWNAAAAAATGMLRKAHCTIDSKHTCIWAGWNNETAGSRLETSQE
jgi:ABC-type transporter Mla MlaB component